MHEHVIKVKADPTAAVGTAAWPLDNFAFLASFPDSLPQGFSDLINEFFANSQNLSFWYWQMDEFEMWLFFLEDPSPILPSSLLEKGWGTEVEWESQCRGIHTITRNLPEKGKVKGKPELGSV